MSFNKKATYNFNLNFQLLYSFIIKTNKKSVWHQHRNNKNKGKKMPFSSINAILNKTCVDCHQTPSTPDILIKINGCSHKHHLHCLIDRSQKVLASTQSMSCHNQCQNTINLEKIIQASEKNAKTAMPQTLATMIQQLAETFTTKTDQETAAQAYHHLASLCGPEQTLFINNKYTLY